MGYWLTAIAAAALTIAAGWFFLLNGGPVVVRLAPSHTIAAPLGGALLGAFLAGGAVVGLLATAGAGLRGWRAMGARRRARREARRVETLARARQLVWTGDAAKARAELLRAPEPPESDASRLALLAETHLQEGDPAAARAVLEGGLPQVWQEPRLLDLLAQAAEALGDRRAALDALERAHAALPASPRLAARLRDGYAAAGRWEEAVAMQADILLRLRSPALLAPERERLVGLRYEASLAEPDDLRAARQLHGLAREAPEFVPAWVSAGDRYARAGRSFLARRAWKRGLRQRPAAVLLDRIEAHDHAAGQPARTTRLIRRVAGRHPGNVSVTLRLARHLLAHEAFDEAVGVLDASAVPAVPQADALRGELARVRGDAAAAADGFARALGPDLGLTTPWRCAACSAASATWTARCSACGRWDTLRAASEDAGGSSPLASDSLIRPER
jgi:tetratricopeptide (TPR) repeat protein